VPAAVEIAVIHGRFQPLHIGHMEYLLAGKERCETLIIGITNPDPSQIKAEPTNPGRGAGSANPCTYYERYDMIDGAMVDADVPRDAFRIVPFPHSFPERLIHYAPAEAEFLLTIYDDWGESKLSRFEEQNLRTHVLWRRDTTVTSGTEIRRRICAGEEWEHLVPAATARTIHRFGIGARIRGMADADARSG
jgi:nicotinamide-nucleotide adenylyltransferase/phosphinothricin biosynthesis protein PhpF